MTSPRSSAFPMARSCKPIGNLAAAIGMSKSGLYAHFGTKEDLQLATVGRG